MGDGRPTTDRGGRTASSGARVYLLDVGWDYIDAWGRTQGEPCATRSEIGHPGRCRCGACPVPSGLPVFAWRAGAWRRIAEQNP